MKKAAQKLTGWVGYLDIYGFGTFLNEDSFTETTNMLLKLQAKIDKKIQGVRDEVGRDHLGYFMFSDTLIIWMGAEPRDINKFRNFYELISAINLEASKENFLFRGACCYGDLIASPNFILGDCYLRAYNLESKVILLPQIVVPQDSIDSAGIGARIAMPLGAVETKDQTKLCGIFIEGVPAGRLKRIATRNVSRLLASKKNTDDQNYNKTIENLISNWTRFSEIEGA